MRITALVENTVADVPQAVSAAWGLAIHVERVDGRQLLFDLGPDDRLVRNARALGIALDTVEDVVLSHHHQDHVGGLGAFVRANERAPIYARRAPLVRRTSRRGDKVRDIGWDPQTTVDHASRLVCVDEETQIAPGVFLLTQIGAGHPRPAGNQYHWAHLDAGTVRDPYDHELVMVVREPDGVVVFTGCSHSGILNMVDAAAARFPGERIKAVVGGFHLVASRERESMAEPEPVVRQLGIALGQRVDGPVLSCHCTGARGLGVLQGAMGDQLYPFATGASVEI